MFSGTRIGLANTLDALPHRLINYCWRPISSSRPTVLRPVTASGLRPIFTTFCYNTRGNPLHVSPANSSVTLQQSFAHALHLLTSPHNIRLPTPLSMIYASNNKNLNSPFSNTKYSSSEDSVGMSTDQIVAFACS